VSACILAGDVGGSKTNLAIYAVGEHARLTLVRDAGFHSIAFADLEAIVARFLEGHDTAIRAAAFGVAGPVIGSMARITNLPWQVSAEALAQTIGCGRVRLMNDLETTAYGALFVDPDELLTLNAGVATPGHRAVIAAGTGLGQALLCWDGGRFNPAPTEGGHVDFGPTDEREIGLLRFLRREHGRVSWERVVSGPGLHNIFRYLDEELHRPVAPALRERLHREDPSAVIGAAGLDGSCPVCSEAIDIFVRLYGAQAGNLALTAMALGGIYVGGGIVTKLLPRMTDGRFLEGFLDKEPHRALMQRMPVWILLNDKTSLLGAAYAAADAAA